jgi:hypothetical protein
MSNTPYERDFYAWAKEQAALLRAGRFDRADIENIAEEIERMGRSEKRELVNRLSIQLTHLLKWRFQPGFRGNSWRLTIEEQRDRLRENLDDNPSLTAHLDQAVADAYRRARLGAERETGLPRAIFPDASPFTVDDILNEDFRPD